MIRKILWSICAIFLLLCMVYAAGAQVFEFELSAIEVRDIDFIPISPFVTLTPDRGNYGSYFVGEDITLRYESVLDGYVSIFNYTPDGKARILRNNERVTAGARNSFRGIVAQPEGTERFLIIHSSWIVPDRILIEVLQNPSRAEELISERAYLNRAIIEVSSRREKTRTVIRFASLPAEMPAGGQLRIRAALLDAEGNALVNRRIQWEVDEGTLDRYQTFTNTAGESEIWFSAPRFQEGTPVRVRALFEGDMIYGPSDETVVFTVNPERIQTRLVLKPESFHVTSGESVSFGAELTDLRGEAVEGRTVVWSASRGSWESEITRTNELGETGNRWFAPRVEATETVELSVAFEGVRHLLPSHDVSYGTVSGTGVYTGKSLYYLDLSGGKADTNFENIVYRGNFVHGYSLNPLYTLSMEPGGYAEVHFHLSQPLQSGAVYLWGKSEQRAQIGIFLNDHKVYSGLSSEGRLTPLESQAFYLSDFLTLGSNRLRLEIDAVEGGGDFYLQRILLVF